MKRILLLLSLAISLVALPAPAVTVTAPHNPDATAAPPAPEAVPSIKVVLALEKSSELELNAPNVDAVNDLRVGALDGATLHATAGLAKANLNATEPERRPEKALSLHPLVCNRKDSAADRLKAVSERFSRRRPDLSHASALYAYVTDLRSDHRRVQLEDVGKRSS